MTKHISVTHHTSASLDITDVAAGVIAVRCPAWPGFRLEGLRPALRCVGTWLALESCAIEESDPLIVRYSYAGGITLTLAYQNDGEAAIRIRSVVRNTASQATILNDVTLLQADAGAAAFGAHAEQIRVLEQGAYWGRVRGLSETAGAAAASGEPNTAAEPARLTSDLVSVIYDRTSRMALLAGFVTSERWLGRIALSALPGGSVQSWTMGFDGGDLQIDPGEELTLEEARLEFGPDPWALLERYADAAAALHPPQVLDKPPVSWCSWYPYRLGVTEERVLDNAKAALRLQPLGLEIMEVDLGWQKDNLPSTFEENERFPHGLGWLADRLREMGFRLGAWSAPYTISELDPLVREHPEWLAQGQDGNPAAYWDWYWEPHGKVYVLDLTHPGARGWLREKAAGLAARGVTYFKADFIGCSSAPQAKARHDRHIAAGGAVEAGRLGAQAIREAMPGALILNCGGPEAPGTGQWPLLYVCNDTGNTGFISHRAQRENYQALATHLYKNRRWGVIQPSCLCVGLPGTLEDARIRATAAFLAGGQIDISDDLTTLPEDRWAVLAATLPPLGQTAKPIDLFDPVYDGSPDHYDAVTKGECAEQAPPQEHPAASVWHVRVDADWDAWDLAGIFSFEPGSSAPSPVISRYAIPLERLGIPAQEDRLVYEFWSGQLAGTAPGGRANAGGYQHPGDMQELIVGNTAGLLEITFFGPAVKLLCLRRPRPHPWVAGTSFHQSCGTELADVAWDAGAATLRGVLRRPPGESGAITLSAAGRQVLRAEVDGRPAPCRTGARGSVVLPVTVTGPELRWAVEFAETDG